MGRPSHQYLWDQVVKYKDEHGKPKWRCKHCQIGFSGQASRIRTHLSGLGKDIRPCTAVPKDVEKVARDGTTDQVTANNSSLGAIRQGGKRGEPSSSSSREGDDDEGMLDADAGEIPSIHTTNNVAADNTTCLDDMPLDPASNNLPSPVVQEVALKRKSSKKRGRGSSSKNVASVAANNAPLGIPSSSYRERTTAEGSRDLPALIAEIVAVMSNANLLKDIPSSSSREATAAGANNKDTIDEPSNNLGLNRIHNGNTQRSRETSNTPAALNNNNNQGGQQDSVDDVLVQFLVSRNLPVDLIEDSSFRTLLTRVAKDGVPSCLLREDRVGLRNSLLSWENGVIEYMLGVKDSWKRTGCTLIPYSFNLGGGKIKKSLVYGLYSPKGFIFVEGRKSGYPEDVKSALKEHVLNFSIDDLTQWIHHDQYDMCEFSYEHNWDKVLHGGVNGVSCIQNDIQSVWNEICEESEWVGNLIKDSETVYNYLSHPCSSLDWWVQQEYADAGKPMSSFARLKSIIRLKDKIRPKGSLRPSDCSELKKIMEDEPDCSALIKILENDEFWKNGSELVTALTPLLEVVDLFDTLCPVSGYVQTAMDYAGSTLMAWGDHDAKYRQIWDIFQKHLSHVQEYYDYSEETYLSPCNYKFWFPCFARTGIIKYLSNQNQDPKEAEKELDAYESYQNPFENVQDDERQHHHPVKLWEKYGGKFPLLKAHAMKLLSRPASCMCYQIKKQMVQIQGTDNIVMRLNYNMMQHFNELGKTLYEPLPSYSRSKYYPGKRDIVKCGFSAIAHALGYGESRWDLVRNAMSKDMYNNMLLYLLLYKDKLNTISKIKELMEAIEWPSGALYPEKWFIGLDLGHVVATTFQSVFVIHNLLQSSTYLPLSYRGSSSKYKKIKEIHVIFLPKENHFIRLEMENDCPLPPVAKGWFLRHGIEDEAGMLARFSERMLCWKDLHSGEAPMQENLFHIPQMDSYFIQSVRASLSLSLAAEIGLSPNQIVELPYMNNIPVFMYEFVLSCINVVGDGNCGFRVIAHALGYGESEWGRVRHEMVLDVEDKAILYSKLYMDVAELKEAIKWLSGPSPPKKWFIGLDMGHVVATAYQSVFVIHNIHQSTTFLPLINNALDSVHKEIHVGFLQKEMHYIALEMQDDCPLPPIAIGWSRLAHGVEDGERMLARFNERMLRWVYLRGGDAPMQENLIHIH